MCIRVPCASCEHCWLCSALEICSPTATPAWGQGLSDYLSFSSLWPGASHAAGAQYTYAPWRKEGAEKGPGTDSWVWIKAGILCNANGLTWMQLDYASHVKHPRYLCLLPHSRTEEVVTNITTANKSRADEQTDGLEWCSLVTRDIVLIVRLGGSWSLCFQHVLPGPWCCWYAGHAERTNIRRPLEPFLRWHSLTCVCLCANQALCLSLWLTDRCRKVSARSSRRTDAPLFSAHPQCPKERKSWGSFPNSADIWLPLYLFIRNIYFKYIKWSLTSNYKGITLVQLPPK